MTREPNSLSGKVVAITGGARGIGRATAAALLRNGAKVAIGDVDPLLTAHVATELGTGCVGIALDVTDHESFVSFLLDVEARLGPLDVMVNNAGVMQLSTFAQEDDAASDRMIDINLRGTITGTRLALGRMLPRNTGHVVNVSSILGKAGTAGAASYSATKHAIIGLSESVRAELGETEIEVSCVMPGHVRTELSSGVQGLRGLRVMEPNDVAAAIVEVLKRPRFDVFVPKSDGVVMRVLALLPRRGRDWLTHALKADEAALKADRGARAAYEQRVGRSEPDRAVAATIEEAAGQDRDT
jgi:NADP-dependent 3-hydroxy acid dehydrogenase YdfG